MTFLQVNTFLEIYLSEVSNLNIDFVDMCRTHWLQERYKLYDYLIIVKLSFNKYMGNRCLIV